ncbi:BLUF domain-containing protein [Vibrio sinaloensis]|uniref:BLUF domain-containing protein n=1 Tax=Photobacterium sp. (strain ATCC 43367) TaxID=379097 RepID=UPI002048BF94|nr:BLUF domain-containing protein [Vibrio sinaloensis]UPQ88950.1 BLUF domain-containing protein [Vibrio sinaloensis]
MFLTRLVYASTIEKGFDLSTVENIVYSAREHNQALDVTGMLCFDRNFFLQCLEGSRTNVNLVYQRILNDKRHSKIIMLDYREISAREFSQWSMGYSPSSSLTAPLYLRYSGAKEFNPYEMSGESAYQLLLQLKHTLPSVS